MDSIKSIEESRKSTMERTLGHHNDGKIDANEYGVRVQKIKEAHDRLRAELDMERHARANERRRAAEAKALKMRKPRAA